MKYIFTLIIIFLLSGCQSIDPILKENPTKKETKIKESGAYSLDDGPEKNLDEIPNAKPKDRRSVMSAGLFLPSAGSFKRLGGW